MTDWQKGDYALCVRGGAIGGVKASHLPRAGQFATVEGVEFGPSLQEPGGVLWILSSDLPPNLDGSRAWAAHRFIKVTPPKNMKLEEDETPLKQSA